MLSYWEYQSFFRDIDVLIIGSGIVGLHAALTCQETDPNLRVVVVERGALPQGGSTRNAGFACFGSMTELLEDLENMGEEATWQLVENRWRGLQKLMQRLGPEAMDYQRLGGYELFTAQDGERYVLCREYLDHFNRQLAPILGEERAFQLADERIPSLGLGQTQHLIFNSAEGHIDTGRMMRRLLQLAREKGVEIFNGLSIENLEPNAKGVEVSTENGWEFQVGQVIVATNGFSRRLLPELDLKPARNQVWITQPIEDLALRGCFHYDQGYVYFRDAGQQQVLIGGARNLDPESETTDQFGESPVIQAELRRLLDEVVIPGQDWQIQHMWSGILGVGPVKAPIIQKCHERLVVAVRMGGMGVAIGSWVGEQAAHLALE
jgi:gamma-glutamylputrescine oxidase